jgi:predicted patatin/cPLA2 family phospholipase
MNGRSIYGVLFALAVMLGACATPLRLDPVPQQATSNVRIFGIENARYYIDPAGIAGLNKEAAAAFQRERKYLGAKPLPPANFLALSGGGDDGAFGAGLLVGWTARGTRPQFKLVTGISTGALSAPFAFLGSAYDPQLREIYTETTAQDIFTKRPLISAAPGDDAMTDSAPLHRTILRLLDDQVVEAIAAEYHKGRLLFVMTTNLDAARPVLWNIGGIAASGHPRARELIAKVLLASASIPAAFPPVLFDVEINGQKYQEMHVDGGAIAQSFLYPPALGAGRTAKRKRTAYVIRNGRLNAPWQRVERDTLKIAGRAVATLTASSGVDDLYRIYATTRRDGVDFNVAYIEDDFTTAYVGPFNRAYMNALFDYGFEKGRAGSPWHKVPPGYAAGAIGPRSNRTN